MNLSELTALWLGHNQLSGPIPPELGSLYDLRELRLGFNRLSGAISPELGNLYDLQWLGLNDNQLSGEIPAELGRFSRLKSLHLQNNQLRGAIPPELDNLAGLEMLFLGGSNRYTGCASEQLAVAAHNDLAELNVPLCGPVNRSPDRAVLVALYHATNGRSWARESNWLTEAPITEWQGVTTDGGRVTQIQLGSRNLSGEIPADLANLPSLTVLELGGNELSGTIPPELGNISSLTVLQLGSNELSGADPARAGQSRQPDRACTSPTTTSAARSHPSWVA